MMILCRLRQSLRTRRADITGGVTGARLPTVFAELYDIRLHGLERGDWLSASLTRRRARNMVLFLTCRVFPITTSVSSVFEQGIFE